MKIGIDLDGVCYEWDRTARYLLRERIPGRPYAGADHPLRRDADCWDYIEQHIAPEHWKWLWGPGVLEHGLFKHGHIVKGTVEGMRALIAAGHDLIVITHRPKVAVLDTLAWLAHLAVPLAGVHILTDKGPKSQVKCDIYVDDKPENIIDIAMNVPGVKLVALFDRRFNRSFDTNIAPYGRVERVLGWDHFVERVRRASGRH